MSAHGREGSGIPARVAGFYLIAGALWIYVTDALASPDGRAWFAPTTQTLKGLGFIVVTSALLYSLLRRQMARLLASQQALQMTQFVIDNAGESVFWLDFSGHIRYCNEVACRSLGYSREELLALSPFDVDRDLTQEKWTELWADLRKQRSLSLERIHFRRDGSSFPVEICATCVEFEKELVTCVFARDISERRKMEQDLRASEERLRQAMMEAPFPVMLHAEDGEILLLSRVWSEYSGYTAADLPDVATWLRLSGAGTWDDVRDKYRLTARFDEGTVDIRTKSGEVRHWELQSSPLGALGDGRRMLLTIAVDATERLALQKQFLQAQKMESVGQLAAGIAHDFNNLLTLILGYGQMLIRQPSAERGEVYSKEILRAGERAAALTQQLLTYSREQPVAETSVIDLHTEIRSLERMLRRIIGEDVELLFDVSPNAGHVLMNPTQFGQIVMNLVVNARDAMPGGGALRIATRRVSLPNDREPRSLANLPPGDYVALHVTDTGAGMTSEVLKRAFDPFFTTKEDGKGTGLGLSTVKQIVERARGALDVESVVGEGTTFAVWLPLANTLTPKVDEAPAEEAKPVASAASIALVEDDRAVRMFVSEVLRSAGYAVFEAGAGDEALALLRVHRGPLDLLVTDIVMPGLNGVDLAARLRAERPGLQVLFMSGYAEAAQQDGFIDADWHFVRKPFSPDALLRAVQDALGAAAAR